VDWLRWADDDYVAARQLLLGDLLLQGAALSNTAIEKYFKTIFLIKRLPHSKVHDIPTLFRRLKKKGIDLNLNEEYLTLLFKLYGLRYPDELRAGFGVGIDRTRLLTELDSTVFEIRKRFKISGPFGSIGSSIEELLARQDDRLLEKNCFFGSVDRATLFAENSSRFAIRVLKPGHLVWAAYETFGIPDTRNFKIEFDVAMNGNKMDFRLPLE
jgi:HEPN domain-containing protein